jgi:hypothetical protein
MIGRVLRPAEGMTDAIVLDHSGAVFRHGLPDDRVEWTLDPDKHATAPEHQKRVSESRHKGLLECTQCSALRLGGQPCPNCGFMPRRPAEYIRIANGDLGLVTAGRATPTNYDPATRARWLGMFAHIANERGYQPGWIAHKHKEKFGIWPAWGSAPEPIPPTPEVRSWVRSRAIAYAKRRGAA